MIPLDSKTIRGCAFAEIESDCESKLIRLVLIRGNESIAECWMTLHRARTLARQLADEIAEIE